MKTNEQEMEVRNSKNRTETGQTNERVLKRKTKLPKTHQDYWFSRVCKRAYLSRDGKTETQIPTWQVRLFHARQEGWFNLGTANQVQAAAKAREIFCFLKANGWESTLAKFKPQYEHKPDMTISEFADFYRNTLKTVPEPPATQTAERYITSLNFICGLVNVKRLADLTPEKVKTFVGKYRENGRIEGRNENSIKISCNAMLRYAGALFSRQMMAAYQSAGLALANPFTGQKLRKVEIKEYSPLRQDTLNTIWQGAAKLRDGDPNATPPEKEIRKKGDRRHRWKLPNFQKPHPQAYAILLLELGLGLRRNEADKAQWDWFFSDKDGRHFIEVKETPFFKPKAKHKRTIPVEPVLYEAIQNTRHGTSPFIVPGRLPKQYTRENTPKNLVYRCDLHHRVLTAWLRKHGITDQKPCHLLRKEFGSYVATAFSLFHAQKMLGHSSPKVTADYYAGLTQLPELKYAKIGK